MGHVRSFAWLLFVALGLAAGAGAQIVVPVADGTLATPSERSRVDKAAFIAQYDDGEVDIGYRQLSATAEFVMLFNGIGADVSLDSVEVCWLRTSADSEVRFEIIILDNDGPAGAPGTELATFAAQATGISNGGTFESHNVDYTTPAGDFYIGVRWNPVVDEDIYVCADHDGADVQPGFFRADETGPWNDIVAGIDASYTALMIRGFFSTPGVVAESLYVPFYLVDRNNLADGTTTLYAVRNLLDTGTSVTIEFFDKSGALQMTENLNLGPHDTQTRNLRDAGGLAVDPDGFARGSIRFTTAGFVDGTPVLAGDYFQVDTGNDFATGEKMLRQGDLCSMSSIRFLDFGAGTRLGILISSPQGANTVTDPPSFRVEVVDENGVSLSSSQVWTADTALELSASDFTAVPFGTLFFDFSNSFGGYVFAEYSAFNRFSVGVGSQCDHQ